MFFVYFLFESDGDSNIQYDFIGEGGFKFSLITALK